MKRVLQFSALLVTLGGFAASATADCDPKKTNRNPVERYLIDRREVYDTRTRLTWQRCSLGQEWKGDDGCVGDVAIFTLKDAQEQSDNPWRLPTLAELQTLISPTCANPAINETVFPGMGGGDLAYWTGSAEKDGTVWYLNFADGSKRAYKGSMFQFAVRLVRTGPPPR